MAESDPPNGAEPSAPGNSTPARWPLLFFLGVLLAILAVVWLPYEITRWYEAGAAEAESEGNLAEAERMLTLAIQREPENPLLYGRRAQLRVERQDETGAYSDCQEVMRLLPDDPFAYQLRGTVNFELKKHTQAVEDFKTVVRTLEDRRKRGLELATAYNFLAYGRAVAKIELDEAVEDANQALKSISDDDDLLGALVACVVSGEWTDSMELLEETVEFVERESDRAAMALKHDAYQLVQYTFPPKGSRDIELLRLQKQLSRIDNRVTVIRRFQAMETDRQNGIAVDESEQREFESQLIDLPDRGAARATLASLSALLDTRGFAYVMRDRPEDLSNARQDLDGAVLAIEAIYRIVSSRQAKHFAIDIRDFNRAVADLQEQVAVIRYHRSLVLDQQQQTVLAERDRQRVRELNFEPGPDLF